MGVAGDRAGSYKCKKELQFDAMTVTERLSHIAALWEQIGENGGGGSHPVDPLTEVRKRLADHEAHPEASLPWEVAREQMRTRR